MKICFNTVFIDGAYGGGMQFAHALKTYIENQGGHVVNNLNDDDIDLILHINPFPFLMKSSSFSFYDAYAYKMKKPDTVIVQRINECDERKGTRYMNDLLVRVAKYSDHIIFISDWLEDLFVRHYEVMKKKTVGVLLNGADAHIFNQKNRTQRGGNAKLKLITHHWGAQHNKGHEVYKKIDDLLEQKDFADKFEFTYVGNYPKNLIYRNVRILEPLSGLDLADELKKHDIYISASLNEPAGMHHVEGALCGLPLLYINSGALPQYCNGYGIEFDESNVEEKMLQMHQEYDMWKEKMSGYNNTAERMAKQYYNLFEILVKNRNIDEVPREKKCLSMYFRLFSLMYSVYWLIKKRLYVR
ncbi:hypothetical protein C0581_02920 [Candidatus Parcubacteria bacterium]|nr:MAG: hypothetical protein C0581_02920 [Candidatus Parcubacteria bacterium]